MHIFYCLSCLQWFQQRSHLVLHFVLLNLLPVLFFVETCVLLIFEKWFLLLQALHVCP